MRKLILLFSLWLLTATFYAQQPQLFQDEKTGKYGYKNEADKVIIKPVYDLAYEFEENLYTCVNIGADYINNKGGKWGAIDTRGKIIIPVMYDKIKYLGYGLFAVNKGEIFSNMDASWEGKYAIFNAAGKALTPFIYTGSLFGIDFVNGFATLEIRDAKTKTEKYGLLDSTGKVALPVRYDDINLYSEEGLIMAALAGKYGFYDKKLKPVIPLKLEGAKIFRGGLAAIKTGGKWGFIDAKGTQVIAPQYEDAGFFEEGLVGVKQNGKWGIIDKENKQLLPFLYDDIVWIKEGGNDIRVKKEGKYIHVNRKGEEIKEKK